MIRSFIESLREYKLLGWRKIKPSAEGFIFWHIVNFPATMQKAAAVNAFDKVFFEWQKAFDMIEPFGRWVNIKSTSDYDKAHIKIVFAPEGVRAFEAGGRSWRIPYKLDGPGGVLAYVEKDTHTVYFDDSEKWADMADPNNMIWDLFDVALHEVGHIFDLAHDDDEESAMTTYYDGSRLFVSSSDLRDLQEGYSRIKRRMRDRLQISDTAATIIANYEGFRSNPYLDPVGVPTIGYGTTYYPDGSRVKMTDDPITRKQALEYLKYHANADVMMMRELIDVPLNQNQRDALTSFVYNIGISAFQRSTLLRKLNEDPNDETIINEFLRWTKAGGKELTGLKKRRKLEAELYFS